MVQLELYTDYLDDTEKLLRVFGFQTQQNKTGFKLLSDESGFSLMLFDPALNQEGVSHWDNLQDMQRGVGVEIVLLTNKIAQNRTSISALGYDCSKIEDTPWGTKEFVFKSKDDFLFRIKQ